MLPILLSIGPLQVFSLGVFLILGWGVFSFLFWRSLRAQAVADERIFDLTFYATLALLIGARGSYVLFNSDAFVHDFLRIIAIWVAPGLSLYGGLILALLTLFIATKRYKLRLGMIVDALAASLPLALIVGLVGGFLDGASIGVPTSLPWAVYYVGQIGGRHPIQIYEALVLVCIFMLLTFLEKRAGKDHWPYGHMGLIFFLTYSFSMFLLEFMKESGIYLVHLHLNQWVHIGLFAESLGALYVRSAGKYAVGRILSGGVKFIRRIGGEFYGKINSRGDKKT